MSALALQKILFKNYPLPKADMVRLHKWDADHSTQYKFECANTAIVKFLEYAARPLTAEEIAQELGLHLRYTLQMIKALVDTGRLEPAGNSRPPNKIRMRPAYRPRKQGAQ